MAEVTKNGDLIYFTVTATNDGGFPNTGVTGTDVLAPGLQRWSWSSNKGSFNLGTGVWTVGNVGVGQSYTLTIVYKVIDISQAVDESGAHGFYLSMTLAGDNIDPNSANNTKTEFVSITTCPPSAGAVDDDGACVCGNVGANDTWCSHGTTEFRLKIGSLVNLDPGFTLGIDGSYNVSGQVINPYAPAQFQYSIWCVVGTDEFETSGPATVTIPALLNAAFTDELIDNGDGTFTHVAVDGTTTTFPGGWTTVAEDSGTGDIVFTYPNGTTYVLDLGNWINPDLTVFPTTITSNITITDLTLRNFHKVNDSGGASISIVIPDPATLGLATNTTKTWTFKRVNVHDTGSITLTPQNMKLIDGAASYVFPGNDLTSVTLWSDGVDYWIK